jgi:hypothetical protein
MKNAAALAVVLVAAASLCGCQSETPPPRTALLVQAATGGPQLAADYGGSGPGDLQDARALAHVDGQVVATTSLAARIVYTSTSGVDAHPDVSGSVFVPRGDPPQDGWPIVSFGHPTTGSAPECAPSLSPDLLGSAQTITTLVKAGYLVVMPDYQGLGVDDPDSPHPYLDSTTVGHNLIDAVQAVGKLVPRASKRWVAFGIGQGGQAAWAANELFVNAGIDLKMLGAMSIAPIADISGLADVAAAHQLSDEQRTALLRYLDALTKQFQYFNIDDYRGDGAGDYSNVLDSCEGSPTSAQTGLADTIAPDAVLPRGPEAVATLKGFMAKTNLPQAPTAAPMFVSYGDQNPLIPAEWTDRAVAKACAMGDTITIDRRPHTAGTDVDMTTVLAWIKERFEGAAPVNDCPVG